jgi:pimeloyl-ACP methyl ester carboxylesterase
MRMRGPFVRRIGRLLLALAAFGFLAVASVLVILWLQRSSEVELPAPSGTSAVGRAIYQWRDDAAVDPAAPDPGTKREILAWIWYPAVASASAAVEDYVPAAMRDAFGPGPIPFRFVYHDASRVRAHSVRNADMAQQSYPVVVMRGGAAAEVRGYTTLAEDLASHGYVVVGIDAPYRTGVVAFPDGRVIRRTNQNDLEIYSDEERPRAATRLLSAWTADIGFALDRLSQLNASDSSGRFTGRLDLTRVGVFGHSFGGAQAAQFCHDDDRCKAGVDIDGRLFGSVIGEGMRKPFMFLISRGRGERGSADPETAAIFAEIRSTYDRLPADTRRWAFIRGANHFAYNDGGGALLNDLLRGALRASGLLEIDGRRQLAITSFCVRTFFDAYLKQQSTSSVELSSSSYPELEVVK